MRTKEWTYQLFFSLEIIIIIQLNNTKKLNNYDLFTFYSILSKETPSEKVGSADNDGNEITAVVFEVGEIKELEQQVKDNAGQTGEEKSQESNDMQGTDPKKDECRLSSKTAVAVEMVLGKIPEVIQLDKLHNNLKKSPKSRYCINWYENHLAKIQVLVLKATKQINEELKSWDAFFLKQYQRLPNTQDYTASDQAKANLEKRKVVLKLLESWKITVHL